MSLKDEQYIYTIRRPGVLAVFDRKLSSLAERIIDGIDEMMATGIVLKNDHTCDLSVIELDGVVFVAKRYNKKGLWHTLRHNLKPSRAKRCWLWGKRLLDLDMPTPKPLGYIEIRKMGLRCRSYLLTEYLKDAEIINAAVQGASTQRLKIISTQVEALILSLEQNGIHHGDLKPPNVMVSAEKAYLIDLDAMKKMNFLTKCRDKNIDRNHLIRKLKRDGVNLVINDA